MASSKLIAPRRLLWQVVVSFVALLIATATLAEPATQVLKVAKLAHHELIHPHRNFGLERQMLIDFANNHALRVEWVNFYTYGELSDAIDAGEIDMTISPAAFDVAPSNAERLAPIGLERYQLIASREHHIDSPLALAGKRIGVKLSSPSIPYFRKLAQHIDELTVVVLPDDLTEDQLLDGINRDQYDVTVVATEFGTELLNDHPRLKHQFDLTGLEPVTWSVNTHRTELKQAINSFLMRYHAAYIDLDFRTHKFHDIKARGVLRAITRLGQTYYVKNGQPSGFDYELARRFADKHNLRLDVLVARDQQQMLDWLAAGVGDVAITPIEPSAVFGDPAFTMSREYFLNIGVVVTTNDKPASTLSSLHNLTIGAYQQSEHLDTLRALGGVNAIGVDRKLNLKTALTRLSEDLIDGFVVPAEELNAILVAHPELVAGISLPMSKRHRWTYRANDRQMTQVLDQFLRSEYRKETYNILSRRYAAAKTKTINVHSETISPFDNILRTYAERYGFDWRLIAAQMYQESRFDPRATSTAGARGLMQIMPTTASSLGLANPLQPEASIHAGVRYLHHLRQRFSANIPESERLWFALAAYNIGYDRVRRARNLAEEMGLDPNRWFDHVELAMRGMTDRNVVRNHCRCGQAIVYVRSIRSLYSAYRYLTAV